MAEESGGVVETVDAGGGAVQPVDAGPSDASFSFPQDFESVGDEPLDAGGEAAPEGSEPEGSPTAPAKSGAQPAGAAAADGKPPGTTAAAQPKPAATPQPSQEAQRPQAAQSPVRPGTGQLLERLTQNREAILGELASSRFNIKLSDAETKALETDAVAALPQILSRVAANLYYEAALASLNQIHNLVPHLTQSLMETNRAQISAESAFYSRWPTLSQSDPAHLKAVQYFANTYRQMNPRATQQEAIEQVGKAASAFLGIQMPQRGAGASPSRQAAGRPFAPAQRGGIAPGRGAANGATDPFLGMGMNFDD